MTYFTQRNGFNPDPRVLRETPAGIEIGPPSKPSFLRDAFVSLASRLLGKYLWRKTYTLFVESRSFLASLRIQLAKDRLSFRFGPSLQSHPQGRVRNRRTLVRMMGIGNLLAIYPWVTHQNFEIFLMGFDAGEQWERDSRGNTQHLGQYEPKNTSESN
jgi:hypothetical protein